MEQSLRARVRAGDPDAFGALFDEHARAVYNHAFRLTGDWAVAEDVVSLTFLEAWRHRGKVEPDGGSLLPWLLGIAVNASRNLARTARRHRAAMSRLWPAPPVQDFAEELAGRIDDTARLREVGTALLTLRRSEREVIALCVWSGLDYASAATALGVPVGTVRSRMSRARAKLRKLATTGDHRGPGDREPERGGGQEEGGCENAARFTQESAQ
jgi:RNA polymerase sigma-70 factor (ECF subfamily)